MKNIFQIFFLVTIFYSVSNSQSIHEEEFQNSLYTSSIREMLSNYKLNFNLSEQKYHELVNPIVSKVDEKMLYSIGGLTLVSAAGVHLYQANAWWKNQRTDFHFSEDWDYALWIDKVGHFFGTHIISHALSGSFEAAGFQTEESIWYGSIGAFLFELYVEIEDGYGPNWGFSRGDATADLLGASYSVFQYYYPFLHNFKFKFSYYPVELGNVSPTTGHVKIFSDDYEGQRFWLSTRVNNLLPKDAAEIWPDWLCIAVGMGVRNLDGRGGGDQNFYIGLDFDVETLPLDGPIWSFWKNSFNFIRLPMPAVRINNGVAFFGFLY